MRIGVDLDKTLLLTALDYNFVDANETAIKMYLNDPGWKDSIIKHCYCDILYNMNRPINKILLSNLKSFLDKDEDNHVSIITGSWWRNLSRTFRKDFTETYFKDRNVCIVSNNFSYTSEEQIALFKSTKLVDGDFTLYIDDDKSILGKIEKVLNYMGVKTKFVSFIQNVDDGKTIQLHSIMIGEETDQEEEFIETLKRG